MKEEYKDRLEKKVKAYKELAKTRYNDRNGDYGSLIRFLIEDIVLLEMKCEYLLQYITGWGEYFYDFEELEK